MVALAWCQPHILCFTHLRAVMRRAIAAPLPEPLGRALAPSGYHGAVFTGIVDRGSVLTLDGGGMGGRLTIAAPVLRAGVEIGASVAVNGVCLTVAATESDRITADLMPETLRRSNLGRLGPGEPVNIERSLRVGDPIGGHFVQGHVDGVVEVVATDADGDALLMYFRLADPRWARYIVEKGFVAVDGISLTVVNALSDGFSVSLVRTTIERTTLGQAAEGYLANLEVDLFARYLVDRPTGSSVVEALGERIRT